MQSYLGAVLGGIASVYFLVAAAAAGADSDPSAALHHRPEVRSTRYAPVVGVQTQDDDLGTPNSLPLSRTLNFGADELQFKLYLNIRPVLGDGAEIVHHGEDGETRMPVFHRSYAGAGEVYRKNDDGTYSYFQDIKASVTYHERDPADVFHAIIRSETEQWTIDPVHTIDLDHLEDENRRRLQMFEGSELASMWMWSTESEVEKTLGEDGSVEWVSATQRRRKLLAIIKWDNCYPGQEEATMQLSTGWLVDQGYVNRLQGVSTVRDNIAQMVADSNVMFLGHMNVEWRIDTILSGNNVPGFTFNEAPTTPGQKTCPSRMGASERLNAFRAWRTQNYPTKIGLFHLMTDCHPPPGTIGIAYVGALCSTYGTGVTTWTGSTTWETVAHELGHNFGSGHTFDKINTGGRNGGIMDYGDGVYEGEHQFHTVHKDEVCKEVSASMAQRRNIEGCWTAKAQTPVTAPTKKPTPKPVVQPVTNPTAPLPTPNPTANPVQNPTAGGYAWTSPNETGMTECNPSCAVDYDGDGDSRSYRTREVHCKDTGTGLEVPDFWCIGAKTPTEDLATKPFLRPNYGVQTCNPAACPSPLTNPNACGDGNHSPLEVCDPSAIDDPVAKAVAQNCCADDCMSWKNTEECLSANPTIDAAFQASDGKVWVFQGDEMAIFNSVKDVTNINGNPIQGYPRPIAGSIPFLDADFTLGIDAAVSREDGTAHLIKGMNYVTIDLEDGQTAEGVKPLQSLPGMIDISGCAKIDTAVSYEEYMYLVCGSVMTVYEHGVGTLDEGAWRTVDSVFQDLAFPDAVDDHALSASLRERSSGRVTFFKAGMNAVWFSAETLIEAKPTPGLGSSKTDVNECRVDNCDTCSEEEGFCETCKPGHLKKRNGRKCKYRKNLMADLDFDTPSGLGATICELLYGGEQCTTDSGNTGGSMWSPKTANMEKTDQGQFGNAAVLTGSERIPLPRVCQKTRNWQVSFWWQPVEDPDESKPLPTKFLTIMRNRGNGFLENFTISMDTHANYEESIFGTTLVLHVSMFGDNHECYVHTPITYDKWNKVTIKFENGVMSTMANGNRHSIAFETASQDDMAVDFCDWWLGDDFMGIKGKIDNFEVKSLDIEPSEESEEPVMEAWEVALMVVGIILGGCCFLAAMYYGARYCYYNKLQDETEQGVSASDYVNAQGGIQYSPKGTVFVAARGPAPKPPSSTNYGRASPPSNFKSQGLRPSGSEERRDSWCTRV